MGAGASGLMVTGAGGFGSLVGAMAASSGVTKLNPLVVGVSTAETGTVGIGPDEAKGSLGAVAGSGISNSAVRLDETGC